MVMNTNWIKITDRARDGITIINKLSYVTFYVVLEYVNKEMINTYKNLCGESATNVPIYSENENALEELEHLVGVSRSDFLLLIKTISYILRRIGIYIIKPSLLQVELKEKLQIQDKSKIDAIVHIWMQQTSPIMCNLINIGYEENALVDMAWKLNVQISSQYHQKDKIALALMQLKTCSGKDVNWEMNFEELKHLKEQLAHVQDQILKYHGFWVVGIQELAPPKNNFLSIVLRALLLSFGKSPMVGFSVNTFVVGF